MASSVLRCPQGGRDGPVDECGVFGVRAAGADLAGLVVAALVALQHRGQEAAGAASWDGPGPVVVRGRGLVGTVLTQRRTRVLGGAVAIGHVRYSTTGRDTARNVQPVRHTGARDVVLAHNGNLVNARTLRAELLAAGVPLATSSDSELLAAVLSSAAAPTLEAAVAEVARRAAGGYAVAALVDGELVAFRDPLGLRPLSLGRLDGDRWCVASETCALDAVGAVPVRDVEPGELVVLGPGGPRSARVAPAGERALCVFEHVYFARADSRFDGRLVQDGRRRAGRALAREAPAPADLVIAVPDSGTAAARGFAQESGLPLDDGLVRNRYTGRSFILPGTVARTASLRAKFAPVPESVAGLRLAVVDDSVVRGSTMRRVVELLRGAGAAEVHLRIASPPVRHPCAYGIDMASRDEMVASGRDAAGIAAELGADSIGYLSLAGLLAAVAGEGAGGHCDACFSGHHRVPIAGLAPKDAFETGRRRPTGTTGGVR